MRITPPALPPPLEDEAIDTPDRAVESTWDALAHSAVESEFNHLKYDSRVRVTWRRFALFQWCCWRRMRIAVVDTQKKNLTFGWTRYMCGFVACQHCGRIKKTYFL